MSEMGFENDQSCRGVLLSDCRSRCRTDMHSGKITTITLFWFESFLDLCQHGLLVHLGSAILGQAGHGRLCGVPVALPVQGEMRGLIRQAAQRITENGDRLPRLHAAEPDLALCKTPIWIVWIGSRAEIDRAGHAPARGVAAKIGVLAIDAQRQRVRAIDIL